MFLWQLAWRNLWRTPKRTLITTIALAITTLSLVFLLSFQIGTYDTMKAQSLKLMDGFGQIQHPKTLETPSIRHSFPLSDNLQNQLNQLPNISWTARASTFVLVSFEEQNSAAMLMGVMPTQEQNLSTLPSRIQQGRFLQNSDHNQIVLGVDLAKQLKINLGEHLQIIAQDKQGSLAAELLEVVGIYDSGISEMNRQLIFMPLAAFQPLFALNNEVHQIALSAQKLSQVESLQKPLQQLAESQHLAYRNWQALQPGLDNGIKLDFYSALVWYLAIMLIVVLIFLNTLLMSILEREREFGLMLSLGLSHKQLSLLIQIETQLTLILGIGLGTLIGSALAYYYSQVGMTLPIDESLFAQFGLSSTLYPSLSLFSIGFSPFILWASGVLMGALLTFRLYKLHPLSGRHL